LNREGFYPPKRTERFTGETVARLLSRRGLHGPRPRAMADASALRPHEYWLADLAREVPMPIATLHKWQRLGWVHSRKVLVASGRWAIWADTDATGAPPPAACLPTQVARTPLPTGADHAQEP
jgi:hypothetical protein